MRNWWFALALGCSGSDVAPSISEKEPDLCEPIWREMEALAPPLKEATGESFRMPSQHEFIGVCRSLPKSAQACLSVRYRIDHASDCEKAMSKLTNKEKKRLTRALSTPLDENALPQ